MNYHRGFAPLVLLLIAALLLGGGAFAYRSGHKQPVTTSTASTTIQTDDKAFIYTKDALHVYLQGNPEYVQLPLGILRTDSVPIPNHEPDVRTFVYVGGKDGSYYFKDKDYVYKSTEKSFSVVEGANPAIFTAPK